MIISLDGTITNTYETRLSSYAPIVNVQTKFEREWQKNKLMPFNIFWTKSSDSFLSQKKPWPKKSSPNFYQKNCWSDVSKNLPKHGVTFKSTLYPIESFIKRKENQSKKWPTPTRNDSAANRNILLQANRNSLGLAEVVRCYSEGSVGKWSPIAEDVVHRAIVGPLNPSWVEWLMGFPVNWSKAHKKFLRKKIC